MSKLEIFTFLTSNSKKYAEYLKKKMDKYCSGDHELIYKCVESIGCDGIPDGWACVDSAKEDEGHNCNNHAYAMKLAQKHIESDFVVFCDADIVILYPGWDNIVIQELNNVDCTGFAYHENELNYQKFPNVMFFAFRKTALPLDFYPRIKKNSESPRRIMIDNTDTSRIYDKPVGATLKCDTGFNLPAQIKLRGLKWTYFKKIYMTDPESKLPFIDDAHRAFCMKKKTHHAEWHLNGCVFGSHKQASRNHPIDGEYGQSWVKRIEMYEELMK